MSELFVPKLGYQRPCALEEVGMASQFDAPDQPLVGRTAELDRVLGLVARLDQGRGAVGLIEGEAGIGKTALLEATFSATAQCDYLVLRGCASELESDRPFAALAEAWEYIARQRIPNGRVSLDCCRVRSPAIQGRSPKSGSG